MSYPQNPQYPQYPQNPQYGQQQYPQYQQNPQYPQNPQYGQQQYGQPQYPQYQQYPQGMPPCPENYLIWTILATLFCCLPLGIVAIVKSTQVEKRYNQGDYQGALKASEDAKTYAIVSAVLGVVGGIIAAFAS